jgi:hypothetical protein
LPFGCCLADAKVAAELSIPHFAYWWMFGVATALIVLIALFTISFQSVKAALATR